MTSETTAARARRPRPMGAKAGSRPTGATSASETIRRPANEARGAEAGRGETIRPSANP